MHESNAKNHENNMNKEKQDNTEKSDQVRELQLLLKRVILSPNT